MSLNFCDFPDQRFGSVEPGLWFLSVIWPEAGQANNLAQIKSTFFKYLFNIYLDEQQCDKEGKPRWYYLDSILLPKAI